MNTMSRISRRTAIAMTACSTYAALGLGRENRPHAQEKLKQADAHYRAQPNGQQRCGICVQFKPPASCQIVAGPITPTGWCQFFTAQENAH